MGQSTAFDRVLRSLFLVLVTATTTTVAQDDGLSDDERREQVAAERFLDLLVRRPTTGTALDRVFGFHVSRGDIGEVIKSLRTKADTAANDDEAGRYNMVVGLLQLQRGEDASAATALAKAEDLLKTNPMAAFHHGQALLRVGNNDGAAEAIARALDRKPPRRDYLNIAAQLGRLYQRAGKTEKALKIWNRLEEEFPGDDGVRQRIARALAEEGDTEGALKRYDSLAKDAKSQNDRIVFALRAADLRVQANQKEQAISDLEGLLAKLRPGSYLYDEARRRIETAFLANGDYAGLSEYYEGWIKSHPQDIGAVLRLARTLSIQGRDKEAMTWFEKAIERAPQDSAPRLALVDAYIASERYDDAAAQYEQLVEMESSNPDYLVRWGQVLLEDKSRTKEERRSAAAKVWQKLTESRKDDAAIQSQVADLLRGAELVEEAMAGYRSAIKLAPSQPQYKEYLGEYLHKQKRTEEALDVWRSLAAGDLKTRENLVRLAEVLHQFEQPKEALETLAEACKMDPTIDERLRYAKWLREAEQFDAALEQIELASHQTDTVDDRDKVFSESVATYQASGKLDDRIEEARKKAIGAKTDAELWRQLAVLYNASRKTREAIESIEKAIESDPDSIRVLDVAAQMFESAGRLKQAIAGRRKLADTDRRFRTGHLQRLATLYMQTGDSDEAIEVGRELMKGASGAIDAFRFYAELCGKVGRTDERLDTLRRCLRMNPRSDDAHEMLASQLAEDFKTEQAIELYWKMLDESNKIDDRREVVTKLTELYLRTNRLDQLITRLEIRGRESGDRRTTVDLVATAHQQAGDLGLAREALESLLREGGRDTLLLERLVALAQQSGEIEKAVELQRQLLRLSPGRQNESRLASLLVDIGAVEEAQTLWLGLLQRHSDREQAARNIDRLFAAGETKIATEITAKLAEEDPLDWLMLLRLLVLQADEGNWKEAAETAAALRKIDLPETTLPVGGKPYQTVVTGPNGKQYKQMPLRLARSQNMYDLQRILDERYGYQPNTTLPKPMDFGHAKLMAFWVICKHLHLDGKTEDVYKLTGALRKKAYADAATSDDVLQWYEALVTAHSATQDQGVNYQTPKTWDPLWRVMEIDRQAGEPTLSQFLSYRMQYSQRQDVNMQFTKLSDERMTWLKQRALETQDQEMMTVFGNASSWASYYGAELRIAKREEEAEAFFAELIDAAIADGSPEKLSSVFSQATAHGTDDQLWPIIEATLAAPAKQTQTFGGSYSKPLSMLASYASQNRIEKKLSRGPSDETYRKRVVMLMDQAIEAIAEQPVRPKTIRLTGVGGPRNSYTMIGGSYQQTMIEFPPKGLGPDDSFVHVFHSVWKVMKDHADDWADHLSIVDADSDPRLQIQRLVAAATILQWQQRNDEAIDKIADATEVASENIPHMESELRLLSADLFLREDRKKDALDVIDSLSVYDQNTMALREFAAARLAAVIGDQERAKNAAKRLFGVRLDTGAQIELAKLMRKLGMRDLASDLVRRMRNRGGSNTDQLQSLMTYFASQGEKDQAAEVAMEVLRRNRPPRRTRSNFTTTAQQRRKSALQTLATSGRLTALIDATKKRFDNSPKSQSLRSELAEMYTAAGKTSEAQALLGGTNIDEIDSTTALEATAKQLVAAGKMDPACDAYIKFLKRKQSTFSSDFYEIKRPFERTKRMGDLADVMMEVGLSKFEGYRSGEVCRELVRDSKDLPKARALFEAMLDNVVTGSNSTYSLSQVMGYASKLITTKELLDKALKRLIEPSLKSTNPWQSLFSGYSTSSDGRHNNATTYLVRALKDNQNFMKVTEEKVRSMSDEREDWHEGKVLLGLLLTQQNKFDEALDLLAPLATGDLEPPPTHDALWLVGSMIDPHEPMHDLSAKIYEYALKETQDDSNREFQYSLQGRACKFMAEIGNNSRSRELALEAIERDKKNPRPSRPGNEEYEAYQKIRNTMSMMEFLKEIDSPADALRIAREFDTSLFAKAGRYQRDRDKAFAKLTTELINEVRQLGGLKTAETMIDAQTKNPHAVDFGIAIGNLPFTGRGLASLWIDMIEEAESDKKLADTLAGMVERLQKLQDKRPDDDTVAAAHAIAADVAGQPEPLEKLVDSWLTEATGESKSGNIKVRNQLLLLAMIRLERSAKQANLPSGLIDRIDTLKLKTLKPKDTAYFLAEAGKFALARKDVESAEHAWTIVCRPGASQWMLLDLSHAAIKANLKDLSTLAFRIAADQPEDTVIDTVEAAVPKTGSLGQLLGSTQTASRSTSNSSVDDKLDPKQVELARKLLVLNQAWRDKKVYTSAVFEPLVKFTVGDKGTKLQPLCTTYKLQSDKFSINSVYWSVAKRANWTQRVDQLLKRIPGDDVASRLFRTISLSVANRGEEANKELEAIDANALKTLPKEQVMHSLMIAAEAEGCREKALEISLAYLQMNKPTRRYEEIHPFDYFALHLGKLAINEGVPEHLCSSFLTSYLEFSQHDNERYSGDTGFTRRVEQLNEVADLLLSNGRLAPAMRYLAMRQDVFTQGMDTTNDKAALTALEYISQRTDKSSAYSELADWTFEGDGAIRVLAATPERSEWPVWLPVAKDQQLKQLPIANETLPLATSHYLLVNLAQEIGTTDDLLERFTIATEKERSGSISGLALVRASLGKTVSKDHLAMIDKRLESIQPDGNTAKATAPLVELQLASVLAESADHSEWAKQMAASAHKHTHVVRRSYLSTWLARLEHLQGWTETSKSKPSNALKHWLPGSNKNRWNHLKSTFAPIWVTDGESRIDHISGVGNDCLWYRVPLSGNFTIDLEMSDGNWSESTLIFDGIRFRANGYSKCVDVQSVNSRDWVHIDTKVLKANEWNQYTIKVTEKDLSYFVNQTLLYREPRKAASPWLGLMSPGNYKTAVRNLKISGEPQVPKEVNLVSGTTLRGWSGVYFDQVLPNALLNNTKREKEGNARTYRTGPKPESLSSLAWTVKDGMIQSGNKENTDSAKQSLLQYERPLGDGSTLRYKFLYEEGKTEVHPAIGQVAYMLRSDGAKRHWIAPRSINGIAADLEQAIPDTLATSVPLKSGAWNDVTIGLVGTQLTIKVNETSVLDHNIDVPSGGSLFGLFHYSDKTKVRVKEVTIEGDWPLELPVNMFSSTGRE